MLIPIIIFILATAIFVASGLIHGFGDGIVWAYVGFCVLFAAGAGGQILKRRRIEQEEDAKRRGL